MNSRYFLGKTLLALLTFALFGTETILAVQKLTHQSEAEISRMSPDERVREYCDEYYHHSLLHHDYMQILKKYIMEDGPKAIPALTAVINDFDPTSLRGRSRNKDAYSFEAEILLAEIDSRVIRLRAVDLGRQSIRAITQVVERMRAAHFDTAPDKGEYSIQSRYEVTVRLLADIQGLSRFDRAVKQTLELRHDIRLSEEEMLSLVNYLILQDPSYPMWSDMKWFRDINNRNDAGYPRQYAIVENPEPFYKEYLKYKSHQ